MAIEINNAMYRQFAKFAENESSRSIAQISETDSPGGKRMKILPTKHWDFIGNVGRSKIKAEANDAVRELFRNAIAEIFGGVDKIPESVLSAMKLVDYGKGKPLTARRIRVVDAAVKAEFERKAAEAAALAPQLGFSGKTGGQIAAVCVPESGLVECDDPAAELKRRMDKNCTGRMVYNAFDNLCNVSGKTHVTKCLVEPNESFRKDFMRDAKVTIDNVTYSIPLGGSDEEKEKAFVKVCDAFVKFATGDKNATFAKASKADKIKANTLMGYACQRVDANVMGGVGTAFNAGPGNARFSTTSLGARVQTYAFSKDETGNIKFEYSFDFTGVLFTLNNSQNSPTFLVDTSATANYSLKATIPAAKFDTFANADWDALADDTIIKLKAKANDMKEGWLDDVVNGIPQEYRLDLQDVDATFSVHTDNASDRMPERRQTAVNN